MRYREALRSLLIAAAACGMLWPALLSAYPIWSGGGSGGGGGSGITQSINSVSSATPAGSAASTNYIYLVTGTTTVTLPTAVGNTNLYTVKRAGTNTVTVATTSAQTVDGSASVALNVQYQSLTFVSDGANWNII